MRCVALRAALVAYAAAVAAITVSTSDSAYVVNTQSSYGFVTTISRSSCDITSLKFTGKELQYSKQASHIGSGLGSATVSFTHKDDTVVVQCAARNGDYDLIHYMVFRDRENGIYMGTQTNAEPKVGELRYIFRLAGGLEATAPTHAEGDVSNTEGGTSVEASDVFLVRGQTRSKFFSSERFIDDAVYCAADGGKTMHACWVRPDARATEKSSGGPFFRDIDLNWGGDYHSVTYYMNSNHAQTEPFRQGFHGPYVFALSRSGVPEARAFDAAFFDGLGLTGYVGAADRGSVKGTATGVSKDLPAVVHWFNDEYQAWTYASEDGTFTSPALVEGNYTMRLYQDEFAAATSGVAVAAGQTTTADIAADNAVLTAPRTAIFKMGEYDGRPTGFLNADKQLRMHPSDARMAPWTPRGSVSAKAAADWPMAMFKAVNDGQSLSFALDAAVAGPATLRIATTIAFAGGRPQATVNGFACPAPKAPTAISSRGVTRGAYRGHGEVYDCALPAGTLVQGDNTVKINVLSGSSGADFLSPNVVFDAIELFH